MRPVPSQPKQSTLPAIFTDDGQAPVSQPFIFIKIRSDFVGGSQVAAIIPRQLADAVEDKIPSRISRESRLGIILDDQDIVLA